LTSPLNQAARIDHRPLIEGEQSDHAISPDDEPPF
jgi:hypothetical protein